MCGYRGGEFIGLLDAMIIKPAPGSSYCSPHLVQEIR
jgi:hypothetical protein